MNIDKIDVANLFDRTQRYQVPLFQRSYVWSEESQWEPLWEDIMDQVGAVQEERSGTDRRPRKHFLGALVLNQVRTVVRRIGTYEVIDGQQRITTLQILLAALRDAVQPLADSYLTSTLERLTENPRAAYSEDERYKVWPTNADRAAFRAVMSSQSREVLMRLFPTSIRRKKKVPPPAIVQCYHFFTGKIEEHLQAIASGATAERAPIERAEQLLDAIIHQLQLVEIQLEEGDDPQVIFETMNARGEPLLPSDLIRNYIFLRASRNDEEVEALYEAHWRFFEEEVGPVIHRGDRGLFWKDSEKRGRLRRTRLDLFLFNYLSYQTEVVFKIEHLFDEFRSWCERDQTDRTATSILSQIAVSSRDFKEVLQPDLGTALGRFSHRLHVLDTTTVYPLLLYLSENRSTVSGEEFDGIIQDFESYLVRRAVCGFTTKNYNRLFMGVLKAMRSHSRPSRVELRSQLMSQTGESVVWPDDTAFSNAWINGAMYKNLGAAKTRMILEALDEGLQSTRNEEIARPNALTVEHVLPREFSYLDWPLPFSERSNEDTTFLQELRHVFVHSIGNLTLLTQPLNSSVSNGPFSRKRPAIAAQSRLLLNSYFQRFQDPDKWDEKTIIVRAKELFNIAQTLWPYPTPSSPAGPSNE